MGAPEPARAGAVVTRMERRAEHSPPRHLRATPVRPGLPALPLAVDAFVGREPELGALAELVDTARIVTMYGPGGVGKSRLAREVAARCAERYPDGVVWVDLGGLPAAERLPHTVATALGIPTGRGADPWPAVVSTLRERRALVVFDNGDRFADGCAGLAQSLLRACAGPHVLVTSREVLRVPGEVTFRVDPMALPAADATDDPAAHAGADAVRLFVERARACRPGFALTPANAGVVGRICRELDGLPLAIELAASRLRLLSTEEILARTADRFGLLTLAPRTSPDRHRGLRAAVESSHVTLDGDERAVFRRLAVLGGGFDLAGATAVAAYGAVEPAMVLDLLAALEAKSLIVAAGGGPDGRLRQLESIRLYARERLVTEGELARCERRFVDWLAGLAEDCLRPVFGAGPGGSRRLDVELDNLTLAADLAAAWRDPRRTVLATAVARGWRVRGAPATARGSLDALPEPAAGPPTWRVRALREAAAIAVQVADYDAAARLAATAVDLARADGDRETVAAALAASGLAHRCRRDHAAAKRHFAECADLLGRLDQPRQRVRALAHLAYTRLAAGDAAGATAVLADVAPDGYPYGSVALLTGDTAAANRLFTDTVATAVPARLPYGLEGLAILADRGGEPARALRLAGAAAGLRDRFGIAPEPFWREQVDRTVSGAGRRFTRPGDPWADGRRWTSAEAVTYAIEGRPPAVRGTGDGPLTARERQVTDLLRAGRTNREIATELGISIRTVEAHLDHVRTKLDLHTRAELAVWAAAQAPAP